MIRESIQYSIHFQKNDMLRINLQPQIKIHQINLVPWITAQTNIKIVVTPNYLKLGILVHKLRITYVQLYIL